MSTPHLAAVPDDANVDQATATAAAAPVTADAPSGAGAPPSGGDAKTLQRARASQALPTDRMTFDKQLDALRALAQQSGDHKRPVTAEDMSAALGLKGNTGGLSNRFFCEAGWVEFVGRGNYATTDVLTDYYRQTTFNVDTVDARTGLAESVRRSGCWFWDLLEPMLATGLTVSTALYQLSKASGASTQHTSQLQMILTWLEWVGLVRVDGDKLFPAQAPGVPALPERPVGEVADNPAEVEAAGEGELPSEPVARELETRQIALHQPTALVSFNFSVNITAEDAAMIGEDRLRAILEFADKLRG